MNKQPERTSLAAAIGPPPRLVGIARLAQQSPQVRERDSVQYFALPTRSALNALACAAAVHGAQFMPFLEKEFPQLARRYRNLYRHSAHLSGDYREAIGKLVGELRDRYGLRGRREEPVISARHRRFALPFA
jgi:hypothetical protein